jgi:hypothetical protein
MRCRLAPSCSRHPCGGGGQYQGCDHRALVFEKGFPILNRTFSKWDAETQMYADFQGVFSAFSALVRVPSKFCTVANFPKIILHL